MKKFVLFFSCIFLLSLFLTNKTYAFSPTDVSGLTAWYKPESLQQLNNNDPVSSWPDSSGNGYTLQQATSSEQPAYLASGINGLPALAFRGRTGTNNRWQFMQQSIESSYPFSCDKVVK